MVNESLAPEARGRRVFYFCYSHNVPRGGQKHTYRHVDVLNRSGVNASIFHPGPAFRLDWFQNSTPVMDEGEFLRTIDPDLDIVVLPEDLGRTILNFPGRKVIFNKNVFTGFQALGLDAGQSAPYLSADVLGAMVVSEHNRRHLQLAYPALLVEKVDVEINTELFRFRPLQSKSPLIACSTKVPEMTLSLFQMIAARGQAGLNESQRFSWLFLEGMSEQEVAAVLNEALVCVTFSVAEGLGRVPLEALASGCLLVTCKLGPLGRSLPVGADLEYGDLTDAVHFLETIMASYPERLGPWDELTKRGRQLAGLYSLENQEASICRAWRAIFRRADELQSV